MSSSIRFSALACLLVVSFVSLSLSSCEEPPTGVPEKAAIEFTSVPRFGRAGAAGGAGKVSSIKGRVIGARPGQKIVLYARAIDDYGKLTWFVQPLVREPFTEIEEDSRWRNSTHPGLEYAALLVEPGFQPPWKTDQLPTAGVVAVAITQGWPPIWKSWWFPLVCTIAAAVLIVALYRIWLFNLTNKLSLRFEERLAERTRVAQELHDTLLQGVISASMQLHVATDQLPSDSPVKPALDRVLAIIARVIEEGRNAVGGLRSRPAGNLDLGEAFSQIQKEFPGQDSTEFRILQEGAPRPVHPIIRDEIYSIGREALINAFRHSRANHIEIELEYASSALRVCIRDNGVGFDPQVLRFGRDRHWGLSGMRERAKRIGAKFRVLSRAAMGTEVELSVPSHIAFDQQPSGRISEKLSGFYSRVRRKWSASPDKQGQ